MNVNREQGLVGRQSLQFSKTLQTDKLAEKNSCGKCHNSTGQQLKSVYFIADRVFFIIYHSLLDQPKFKLQ